MFDSAGVRRRTKIKTGPEQFSVLKVYEMIKKMDICLLLLTVEESLARADLRLANHLIKSDCGVILVMTKFDLIGQSIFANQAKIEQVVLNKFKFSYFWPIVFVSSKTNHNLDVLLDEIMEIDRQRRVELSTP